jgi:hypothetical protein
VLALLLEDAHAASVSRDLSGYETYADFDAAISSASCIRVHFFLYGVGLSMPPVTALLHTENDALRLGRALETLRPCNEIIIVDHGSRDATVRIAREYGAHVFRFKPESLPGHYLQSARCDWILCLDPRESLTEGLEATLLEWKSVADVTNQAFSVFLREETPDGWLENPMPQTRLIPRSWTAWHGVLPKHDPSAIALEGELLRFLLP